MIPNSGHIGMIIVLLTIPVVVLLIAIYNVKQYKKKQLADYRHISEMAIKSIDVFSQESKKLNKLTDCLIQEMVEFKQSDIYKEYKNGNGK